MSATSVPDRRPVTAGHLRFCTWKIERMGDTVEGYVQDERCVEYPELTGHIFIKWANKHPLKAAADVKSRRRHFKVAGVMVTSIVEAAKLINLRRGQIRQ